MKGGWRGISEGEKRRGGGGEEEGSGTLERRMISERRGAWGSVSSVRPRAEVRRPRSRYCTWGGEVRGER